MTITIKIENCVVKERENSSWGGQRSDTIKTLGYVSKQTPAATSGVRSGDGGAPLPPFRAPPKETELPEGRGGAARPVRK